MPFHKPTLLQHCARPGLSLDRCFAVIIGAIGLLVLLLGTATGNVDAMLTMAMVGLVAILICFRQKLSETSFWRWLPPKLRQSVLSVLPHVFARN